MSEARELIAAFHEIDGSGDRSIGRFTPALIGMFGTTRMFDVFLDSLDQALAVGAITLPLKERAANLTRTFIPQVAGMNGVGDLAGLEVTADQLRAIRADSPEQRRQGVRTILAALMKILGDAQGLGS